MDLAPIPRNRLRGPANLVCEEWPPPIGAERVNGLCKRPGQGKFVGARGWTGAARVHGLQETRRDGSARRTRTPWETETAILGQAFTGQKTGFIGRPQTACTVAGLSVPGGQRRWHRVHTRLRMGGRTRCRGSRETPGSLSSAPPWDRSARPGRPIRPVRRGSSRPQRQGVQGPTRAPAVAASGIHDALAVRRYRGDANGPLRRCSAQVFFVFLAPGDRSRRPRRRKAARFTRARRAAAKPRGRHHPGVKTNASVTQNGYDSSKGASGAASWVGS